MNAGAYGGEMKDILVSADLLTKDGEVVEVPVEEISLSYRHSRVMETGEVVLGVTLKLVSGEKEKIEAVMQELRQKRQEKQPLEFPSAGSTFKRPEGYFAGKLIMDCLLYTSSALDFIGNMWNYLNSTSTKVSTAFFLKYRPVNLSGSNVRILGKTFINETFIMA